VVTMPRSTLITAPATTASGVTPLMMTALVVGDANAPTCDVRTTAPNPGRATGTPPDLDALALRPGATYCAAALTKDVKSEPDGRRTGIVLVYQWENTTLSNGYGCCD